MINLISRGGPVMAILITLSVVVLGFITERLIYWWGLKRCIKSVVLEDALSLLFTQGIDSFRNAYQSSLDPLIQVFLNSINVPNIVLKERLSKGVEQITDESTQFLPIISTIVTLAPLLGILGTVTGIMSSFKILGMETIADPHQVTLGIAQALITTAAGLAIAMFGLIFYNYFLHCSQKLESRNQAHANEFAAILLSLRNNSNS
ncbi:MAG: biopolymer transport protein ExbB [Candidatus Omnitrophota bacterium]|jgi:biopolymer transport protein ExbB